PALVHRPAGASFFAVAGPPAIHEAVDAVQTRDVVRYRADDRWPRAPLGIRVPAAARRVASRARSSFSDAFPVRSPRPPISARYAAYGSPDGDKHAPGLGM